MIGNSMARPAIGDRQSEAGLHTAAIGRKVADMESWRVTLPIWAWSRR